MASTFPTTLDTGNPPAVVLWELFGTLVTEKLPVDVVKRDFAVPEASGPCIVVLSESSELLEVGEVLLDVVEEFEILPKVAFVELALARGNVDSLKQDTSLKAS